MSGLFIGSRNFHSVQARLPLKEIVIAVRGGPRGRAGLEYKTLAKKERRNKMADKDVILTEGLV